MPWHVVHLHGQEILNKFIINPQVSQAWNKAAGM